MFLLLILINWSNVDDRGESARNYTGITWIFTTDDPIKSDDELQQRKKSNGCNGLTHFDESIEGWKVFLREMIRWNRRCWRKDAHPIFIFRHINVNINEWMNEKAHIQRFPIILRCWMGKFVCFLEMTFRWYHVKYPIMVKIHQQAVHTHVQRLFIRNHACETSTEWLLSLS